MCQIYTHHTETRYRTSNGHTRTEHVEVTDFLGQVFSLCLPINFSGHLRVVPTKKSFLLRGEVNGVYPGARGDEVQIETEGYSPITKITISTARMNCLPVNFSPLRCWNGLIDKFLKMPCVYFGRQETIYFFVYRSLYLSDAPKPEDIDQLSLVSEYHKLCRELALIKRNNSNF